MNLSQLIVPQAVLLADDSLNAATIIRKLGDILYAHKYVNNGFIEATLRREASMPTGLPLGGEYNAAIPHVDIEYVNKPGIALATLKTPVIFQNMVEPEEAVPVQLVFMLALDKPKSQIDALQQIAGVLQEPEVITGLMSSRTPDDAIALLARLEPSSST